jgi:hypothetical protein
MSMETSASVYDELSTKLKGKGLASLNNVKSACDLIVTSKGIMNFTRVAKVATAHFGAPKIQSVQNSDTLKRYINARIHEYRQDNPYSEANSSSEKHKSTYPVSNLDPRTKIYIDQLHDRLNMLEHRNQQLRQWQENFTRVNPINMAKAVSTGANSDGAISIEYQEKITESDSLHADALTAVLRLPDYINNIVLEEQGNQKRLTLKRPSGDYVIWPPEQLVHIEAFLRRTEPTKGP